MNLLPLELFSVDRQPGMSRDVTLAIEILHHHVVGPFPSGVPGKEIHSQDQHSCPGNDELYRRIGSGGVLRSYPISHISTTKIYTGAEDPRSVLRREIPGFEMLSEVASRRRVVPDIVVIPRRLNKCDLVRVKNRPGGFCILDLIGNWRLHAIANAYYGLDISV